MLGQIEKPFSSLQNFRLPSDSIPGHPYQTGDGASIFFQPSCTRIIPEKITEVINLEKTGLESIEPVQLYPIGQQVVRIYKFNRRKRGRVEDIPFREILEDLLLVTSNYFPSFVGKNISESILPEIQRMGKIFHLPVFSPCEKFMEAYHGPIFGFKIFHSKECGVSRHNYCHTNIDLAGYVVVVCKK